MDKQNIRLEIRVSSAVPFDNSVVNVTLTAQADPGEALELMAKEAVEKVLAACLASVLDEAVEATQ